MTKSRRHPALSALFALSAGLALPVAALADPDKDESGHGKHRHGRAEYKHEYWDGNCKVEIKQKNGEYKEERKCRPGYVYAPAPVVVVPQPVYVPAPAVVVEPGITIHGTIRVK